MSNFTFLSFIAAAILPVGTVQRLNKPQILTITVSVTVASIATIRHLMENKNSRLLFLAKKSKLP